MADNNIVTIISESRNLRALPFRPTENQLSVGKEWEEWLDAIEREFRYFRINSPADRKDALIIYGGTEIARLEKTLPDNDPDGNLDDYQKVKQKLNDYFQPKRNKHHARYIFLKSRPEAGETIVAYATRLREKAQGCDFGSSNDDRILANVIHHSSQSLDDSSVAHVRIKTVKQSLPQENEDSRQIKELQEGISRLQKDLDSAKNLIQQILVQQRMTVVGLDEAINEKERFMESYDLSRNTDMKRTYLTSKKINMGTTERIEGCVHNNKMNVKNEERMTRSNRTGRRSRSKRKHMRPCLLDKAIHSDYLFNLSN